MCSSAKALPRSLYSLEQGTLEVIKDGVAITRVRELGVDRGGSMPLSQSELARGFGLTTCDGRFTAVDGGKLPQVKR